MNDFKANLAKLVDLKTIVTLAITFGVVYGFVVKIIDVKEFMMLAIMVYTFYFTKKDPADTTISTTETTSTTGDPNTLKK